MTDRRYCLSLGDRELDVRLKRNTRARRYILRVGADAAVHITVPRYGSVSEALAFATNNRLWIARQLTRQPRSTAWARGTEIHFRGASVPIAIAYENSRAYATFADQRVAVSPEQDLRPPIEAQLRWLATQELPPRVHALAMAHDIVITGVSVRNQRARWGSCSAGRRIALNWRLIQTPPAVSDYVIVHELMHCREMNHSPRFWRHVAAVCPDYADAETWLRIHHRRLFPPP